MVRFFLSCPQLLQDPLSSPPSQCREWTNDTTDTCGPRPSQQTSKTTSDSLFEVPPASDGFGAATRSVTSSSVFQRSSRSTRLSSKALPCKLLSWTSLLHLTPRYCARYVKNLHHV